MSLEALIHQRPRQRYSTPSDTPRPAYSAADALRESFVAPTGAVWQSTESEQHSLESDCTWLGRWMDTLSEAFAMICSRGTVWKPVSDSPELSTVGCNVTHASWSAVMQSGWCTADAREEASATRLNLIGVLRPSNYNQQLSNQAQRRSGHMEASCRVILVEHNLSGGNGSNILRGDNCLTQAGTLRHGTCRRSAHIAIGKVRQNSITDHVKHRNAPRRKGSVDHRKRCNRPHQLSGAAGGSEYQWTRIAVRRILSIPVSSGCDQGPHRARR